MVHGLNEHSMLWNLACRFVKKKFEELYFQSTAPDCVDRVFKIYRTTALDQKLVKKTFKLVDETLRRRNLFEAGLLWPWSNFWEKHVNILKDLIRFLALEGTPPNPFTSGILSSSNSIFKKFWTPICFQCKLRELWFFPHDFLGWWFGFGESSAPRIYSIVRLLLFVGIESSYML